MKKNREQRAYRQSTGRERDASDRDGPPLSGQQVPLGQASAPSGENQPRAGEEALPRVEQLSAVLAAIRDGLVVYDRAGYPVAMNDPAERLFGVSHEEMRALPPEERTPPPMSVQTVEGHPLAPEQMPSARALRGETVMGQRLAVRRPDGKMVPLIVNAAAMRDQRGQVVGAVVTFNDISDLVELQRAQQEMASIVAHDIRQPLTIILGQAQLLCRRLDAGDIQQARRSSEAIATSAQRMNVMIQDLVDSLRVEAGRLELSPRPIDLGSYLRDLLQRSATALQTGRVRLSVPPGLPPASADPNRLDRIVLNLLSHSLKYSGPESPVDLRVERANGEVVVSMHDLGPDIAPQDLPHVFERFYRAKGPHRKEGIGLGLYLSRLLVEAQGGRIWVESAPGQGSTFLFTLPLA